MAISKDMTTYNLRIPSPDYDEIRRMAEKRNESINNMMLRLLANGRTVEDAGYDHTLEQRIRNNLITQLQEMG